MHGVAPDLAHPFFVRFVAVVEFGHGAHKSSPLLVGPNFLQCLPPILAFAGFRVGWFLYHDLHSLVFHQRQWSIEFEHAIFVDCFNFE
jgi:hypothetical protein